MECGRVKNKDRDFWEGLKKWDMIVLSEIWVKQGDWERIRNKLSKGYK